MLLLAEPSASIRVNYTFAEREFRAGKIGAARRDFMRVFKARPRSKLGIRAYFRAADAEFELLKRRRARNYHNVIINYQAAIRAADTAGYDTQLIPHAIFRIARAYQLMNFHNEADVHFRILQDRFPDNDTYTVDSYFYQGQSYIRTRRFEDSIRASREFLERDGDLVLQAPAYYTIGDALYNLGRYAEAKRDFDRARRADPDYPTDHAVLLFRMGETYYENAEFFSSANSLSTRYLRFSAILTPRMFSLTKGLFGYSFASFSKSAMACLFSLCRVWVRALRMSASATMGRFSPSSITSW